MVTLKVVTISSFVPSPSCRCGDIESYFVPIPHVVEVALKAMTISSLLVIRADIRMPIMAILQFN